MANFTPNINLRKPVPTENFDIDRDFNANWDTIDEELGNLEAGVANTYTKAEVDTKDSLKADKADTYTKAEVDAKDATKVDLSDYLYDYDELRQDVTQHNLEYVEQRSQDQLKVAKVEKDINDYQSTMASMNPNQEVKQKATGYGLVSLPKNTANGQVSGSVKGLTATNIIKNGNFSDGTNGWQGTYITISASANILNVKGSSSADSSVGNSVRTVLSSQTGDIHYLNFFAKTIAGDTNLKIRQAVTIATYGLQPTFQNYSANFTFTENTGFWGQSLQFGIASTSPYEFEIKSVLSVNLTATFGAGNEPTKEECDKIFANYFEGTKSTISTSRLKSVGKNLSTVESFYNDTRLTGNFTNKIRIKAQAISFSANVDNYHRNAVRIYDINDNEITTGEPPISDYSYSNGMWRRNINSNIGIANIRLKPRSDIAFVEIGIGNWDYNRIVKVDSVMVNYGDSYLPYEPYTESTSYLPNVGELHSVPNGTKDEIRDGKHYKRVSGEVIIDGNLTWKANPDNTNTYYFSSTNWSLNNNAKTQGSGIANSDDGSYIVQSSLYSDDSRGISFGNDLNIRVEKTKIDAMTGATTLDKLKAYLNLYPITLTYQLAEPIITPIEVSGTLLSNPSGTVYVEKVVADAGIYNNGIATQYADLPIKTVDKLIKYDFETGVQTSLDVSKVVINANKLSFTHPDLVNGDMVFYDYFYDVESTEAETEIEYYDSRHTIEDTTNGKFYGWKISSTNGVATVELTEV